MDSRVLTFSVIADNFRRSEGSWYTDLCPAMTICLIDVARQTHEIYNMWLDPCACFDRFIECACKA